MEKPLLKLLAGRVLLGSTKYCPILLRSVVLRLYCSAETDLRQQPKMLLIAARLPFPRER